MPIAPVQVPYVLAFAFSGLVALVAAGWVHRRYDARGTRELAYALAVTGVWAGNSALRVLAADPLVTHFLLSTEMLLVALAAALWFVFAATYADRPVLRTRWMRYVLAAYVASGFLVPLTNPLHGLMWASVTPTRIAGVVTYTVVKGPAHYVLTVLAYVFFLVGVYYLAWPLWSSEHSRGAVLSLVSGFVALALTNLLVYVAPDLLVTHTTTITPLGATFAAFGALVALQYDLFRVVPVARESVVETMHDPLAILDRRRRLVDVNEAFREEFGTPAGAPRPFAEVYPDLADALDLSAEQPQDVRLRDADGRDRYYSVTVSAVESGHHLVGYSLVFRDVSGITEAKLELERQNEQLDEFAYSAAHNLRNPLGIISGYADLLGTHLETVDADAGFDRTLVNNSLDKIDANARRMEEIIVDFLRVVRASKSVSTLEPVELGEAARTAFDSLDDADDLSLLVDSDGHVRADPVRLETLLGAVFRSARDRATGPTDVRVELTPDGFVVEDTAQPIDLEDATVFLTYGYTTKYPGTGLGLAVARTLAQGHRWTIDVDPEYTDGLRVVVTGARTDHDDGGESTPESPSESESTPASEPTSPSESESAESADPVDTER